MMLPWRLGGWRGREGLGAIGMGAVLATALWVDMAFCKYVEKAARKDFRSSPAARRGKLRMGQA